MVHGQELDLVDDDVSFFSFLLLFPSRPLFRAKTPQLSSLGHKWAEKSPAVRIARHGLGGL